MGFDLSGALNSVAGDLPTANAILTSVVTGAVANTVLTGVKHGGLASIDVLGLFPKDTSANPAPAPAPLPATPMPVTHPSMPKSVFDTLNPAQQAGFWAAGGTLTAG
jgi:hypothetical protein